MYPKKNMLEYFSIRLGVELKPIGQSYRANCPFCLAKNALEVKKESLSRWYCHSCTPNMPRDSSDLDKMIGDDGLPENQADDEVLLDWQSCSPCAPGNLAEFWNMRGFGDYVPKAIAISNSTLKMDGHYWRAEGDGKSREKSTSTMIVVPVFDPANNKKMIGTQRISTSQSGFKNPYGSMGGAFSLRGSEHCKKVIFVESMTNAMALACIGYHAVCLFSACNVRAIRPIITACRARENYEFYLFFDACKPGSPVSDHIASAVENNPTLAPVAWPDDQLYPQNYDINDLLAHNPDGFETAIAGMIAAAKQEKLALAGVPTSEIAQFPINIYPDWLQRYCKEIASSTSMPLDFYAAGVLPAFGVALQEKEIAIHSDWTEKSRIWMAMIGEPSSGKSVAVDKLLEPVQAVEAGFEPYNDVVKEQVEQARIDFDIAKNLYKENKKKGFPSPPPKLPVAPPKKRAMTSDATVESLHRIISDGNSVLLKHDEISGWVNGMNQYKRGGSDREFFLSAWSGASTSIDRKNETLYLKNPHLSILGATTPANLKLLVSTEDANDGLTARFLFVFPENTVQRWTENRLSPDAKAAWHQTIDLLFATRQTRRTLALSQGAMELFASRYDAIGDMIAAESDSVTRAWLGKGRGYIARFALILAMAENPETCEIKEKDISGAWELFLYFKNHASRVFECAATVRLIAAKDPDTIKEDLAGRIMAYARKKNINVISVRMITRSGVKNGLKANEVRNVFAQMVENGIAVSEGKDAIKLIF